MLPDYSVNYKPGLYHDCHRRGRCYSHGLDIKSSRDICKNADRINPLVTEQRVDE